MRDSDEEEDEILEIKRAMKEARTRKKLIIDKAKHKIQQSHYERNETDDIIRKLRNELETTKKQFLEREYELKEAKYEITQWNNKYTRLEEEKTHSESIMKSQLQDNQLKIESLIRISDEKFQMIAFESEKVIKLFETLLKSSDFIQSQTNQHILMKSKTILANIRSIAYAQEFNSTEYRHKNMMIGSNNHSSSSSHRSILENQLVTVDSTVDSTMLEMCRSLEEENAVLTETVNSLKEQLAESKRESAASQLIPHYRLAITRSRTYAANILEQLRREQATSQSLREQLDETYQDLKKVVEEKRKLYQQITRSALEDEENKYQERDKKLLDRDIDEEIENTRLKMDSYQRTKASGRSSSSQSRERRKNKPKEKFYDEDDREYHNDEADEEEKERIDYEKRKKKKEQQLQNELKTLDSQIESIKEKLGQAALQQSQKILNEVLDTNLSNI